MGGDKPLSGNVHLLVEELGVRCICFTELPVEMYHMYDFVLCGQSLNFITSNIGAPPAWP